MLPTGAEELLIAMATPTPYGAGVPALIESSPGQGKTSFIQSLASKNNEVSVYVLPCAMLEATDLLGIPYRDSSTNRTCFAPPEFAYAFDDPAIHSGILFADEINCAPMQTQAAFLRLVQNREAGRRLPDHVRIVAACNATGDRHELLEALVNRFVQIAWHVSQEAFAQAKLTGYPHVQLPTLDGAAHAEAKSKWSGIVSAFMQRSLNMLHTSPESTGCAFASPRTWDMLIALAASCELLGKTPQQAGDSLTFFNLCNGCVGSAATTAFIGFLKHMDLPSAIDFLQGKAKLDLAKTGDDALYTFFCILIIHLSAQKGTSGNASTGKGPPPRTKTNARDEMQRATRVMRFIDEVCRAKRVDTIFVPLRKLLQESRWLQNVTVRAYEFKGKESIEFERALECLNSSELVEFAEIIAQPNIAF